jgi:hypothetical protein
MKNAIITLFAIFGYKFFKSNRLNILKCIRPNITAFVYPDIMLNQPS